MTWSINGASFDGSTGYIDSDWNGQADGINFQKSNALTSVFLKNYDKANVSGNVYGCLAGSVREQFVPDNGTGNTIYFVTNTSPNGYGSFTNSLSGNLLASSSRESDVEIKFHLDGILTNTASSTVYPTGPFPQKFAIGAKNNNGTIETHYNGTISSWMVGSAIGFDHSAHNTNVRQLLTDLGLTL